MSAAAPQVPVRILHLSDLHFRAAKAWDSDPVLRALAHFLAGEVKAGLAPDLVVITGDLAFSGKAEEYAQARSWLDAELWPGLAPQGSAPVPRERLLLVPGNHDANRGEVDMIASMVQKGLLSPKDQNEGQSQIATVLGDPGQRETLLKRHRAYLDFYGAWLAEAQQLPWWQRSLDVNGQRLHVAGLDSAWMACGDEDRGRLLLGRW